jgi:dihydrofolate synthase/folylpolyglutamate synthase
MTYLETLDYLYGKLPMFTRIGAAAYKKDLHNTLALCGALGNPHHHFKSIHVGGTNGKGSTSHMLAAIMQQTGYKTGLYTSPHLKDFRERIRINGEMVPTDFVCNFVTTQQELIDNLEPSFFEVTVGMAFSYFAHEQVDIAIIEVGLGGRLDSTNIITPELAVITNISLDHTNILGDNLAAIAQEKAGIIKPAIPVVIGERHPETDDKFIFKAGETLSPLVVNGY